MYSKEQMDAWFTYHAPTSETLPKFEAIGLATETCMNELCGLAKLEKIDALAHERVNQATRALAEVIDASAPDGDDKDGAIRCVRLARNAANEIVRARMIGGDCHDSFLELVIFEITKARWQANAAVALGAANDEIASIQEENIASGISQIAEMGSALDQHAWARLVAKLIAAVDPSDPQGLLHQIVRHGEKIRP